MRWLLFLLRGILRRVSNLFRRLGRAPQIVSFTLEGSLPELSPPVSGFLRRRFRPRTPDLQDLGEAFRHVASDGRVSGIVLRLAQLKLSPAAAQSLRDLILSIRQKGLHVAVWATQYGMIDYYVATSCDEILLQQGGSVVALGLARSYLHLADALAKVGLEGDFVQISPYKTASDMLTRREMSEEAREMSNWLAEDAFEQLVEGIATGRNMPPAQVRQAIDSGPHPASAATELGMVDSIVSEEALPRYLAGDRTSARIAPYTSARRRLRHPPLRHPGKHVAILRVAGDIIDGRSSHPPVRPPFRVPLLLGERAGDLTVVQQARAVARNRRVGAAVVYVDSGGGSATASEAMAAALHEIATRKPVVVSMGPLAASGGYYVATPGTWIMAQPGTITGSIGVVSGKLVNAGLFEKLLFHRETVQRGERAGFYSPVERFSREERERVHEMIRSTYSLFLDRVGRSRGLSTDQVDAVGGGRVWTGRQALDHGLVDEIGGLDRAIAKAKELAGLHPRASVHQAMASKREAAPLATDATSAFRYAWEGAQLLGGGRSLCLSPLILWPDSEVCSPSW